MSKTLQSRADRRACMLKPGGSLVLDAQKGILASRLRPADIQATGGASVVLPPDGLLVFAVDAPKALMASGVIVLDADDDLRPGLRATVL